MLFASETTPVQQPDPVCQTINDTFDILKCATLAYFLVDRLNVNNQY